MTTPDITIPHEALEAAAKTAWEMKYKGLSWLLDCPEPRKAIYRKRTHAACLAMLKAWPGMFFYKYGDDGSEAVILPLPKEPEA